MHIFLTVIGIWCVVSLLLGLFVGRVIAIRNGVVIVAACVAGASTVSAQERVPTPAWPAYSVMVVGNVADIWTTHQAFGRGAQENNGITTTSRIGLLALSKVSAVIAVGMAMRLLERHGHPRIARVVGILDGGATAAAAVHNHRTAR